MPKVSLPKVKLPSMKGGPGPLSLLFAGLEFGGRKLQGQTNLQAGVGAGASAAGGSAGFAAGAKLVLPLEPSSSQVLERYRCWYWWTSRRDDRCQSRRWRC